MTNYYAGVKFVVADSTALFGNTTIGGALREWCRHNGWALAWVLTACVVIVVVDVAQMMNRFENESESCTVVEDASTNDTRRRRGEAPTL